MTYENTPFFRLYSISHYCYNYSISQQAEPEFQYGAEAFEAYQQSGKAETAAVAEVKKPEIKDKSR